MDTLTRDKLFDLVHQKTSLGYSLSCYVVDAFFDEIFNSLANGDEVLLQNFGAFHLRDKCSRPGRNLSNGEQVLVTERRVVTFKGSEKLLHRINVV